MCVYIYTCVYYIHTLHILHIFSMCIIKYMNSVKRKTLPKYSKYMLNTLCPLGCGSQLLPALKNLTVCVSFLLCSVIPHLWLENGHDGSSYTMEIRRHHHASEPIVNYIPAYRCLSSVYTQSHTKILFLL